METDPQSIETNQDSEDHPAGSTQAARSYECTFCKRGFSNAQALGGHMNIHRKDRAKLKQPPNDTLNLPFDIITTKNNALFTPAELECSDVTSATFNWPWLHHREEDLARDETHVAELRQLPLFVDVPACSADRRSDVHEDRHAQSSQGSVKVELDLELRLGPEPQPEPEPVPEPPSLSLSMGLKEFP